MRFSVEYETELYSPPNTIFQPRNLPPNRFATTDMTLSVAIGRPVPTKRLVKPSAIGLGFSSQGSLVQNQNEGPAMLMQACLIFLSAVKNTLMTIGVDVDVDVAVALVRSITHDICHATAM